MQPAAAEVDVTFQVDMSEYAGAYGSVNINGSFNGWCGACAAMTDADADGIFDITISLAPGTYEYKFTLDGWTAQEEFVPRVLLVQVPLTATPTALRSD